MKKRLLSIFLCFCICLGLIPVSVFARNADDGLITQYGDGAPDSTFKGHVLQLTEEADQGAGKFYSIHVGIQNIGESNVFILNLKYDTSKLRFCDNTGEDYEGEAGPSDAIVLGKVTKEMFKASASESNKNTYLGTDLSKDIFGSPIITTEGKAEGCVSIGLSTSVTAYGAKLRATFEGLSTSGSNTYTAPANKIIWLYTVYLKPINGAEISRDSIGLYSDIETDYAGATGGNGANVFVDPGVYFQGWPEAPVEYGSVKVSTGANASTPLGGVSVTLAPKTRAAFETQTVTTSMEEADFGTYTFTNVPTGDYTLTVARDASGRTKDGKTYQLGAASENDVTVEKDKETEVKVQSGFTEVETKYAFTLKAVNASGEDVTLTSSALSSTNVSEDTDGTAAAGQLAVSTAVTGDNEITLQGLDGYQKATVTLNITGSNNVISKIECADPSVSIEGTVVTVKMAKTTTNVTVPLPVPTDPDTNEPIDEEQAKKMEVTFTPKTDDAKAELGENIKVPVKVEKDSEGNLTITVDGDLPDGAYTMTIGGEGYNATELDVTVITTPDGTHVVNVGGTPAIGEDGEVTGVTGGVTGTQPGSDPTSNGKVDLTGGDNNTTIVEGGSIDVSDPENPSIPSSGDAGVKDVTGGLLDSETAKDPDGMGGQLTPSVDTDPTYEVVLKLDSETAATKIIAEVYLKNLAAQHGVFGMYYDPKLFDTVAEANVTLNPDITGLQWGTTLPTTNPDISSSYVAFDWEMGPSGAPLSGNPLLATIELPLNSSYIRNNDKLLADIDTRSIYTEDYSKTVYGTQIMTDAAGDQDLIDELLGAAWRYTRNTNKYAEDAQGNVTGVAWHEGHAEFLADSKATRDGFYQAYDDQGIAYDVRMVFKPEFEIKKYRADFWVTEPEDENGEPGADIGNAEIYISKDLDVIQGVDDWSTMTKTKAEGLGMTVLTTDAFGNANTAQPEGTYYFVVMEDGHWTYPDGKAGNDQNPLYASYTLSATGIAAAGDYTTNVLEGYLNPQMASKTFHKVALEPKDSGDENATINSAATAYNTVDYYFTLAPKAGYQFKVSMEDLISTTDPKLTAKLYDANAEGADEAAAFRDGEGTVLEIKWDPVREMFYITGGQINLPGIGDNDKSYDPLRGGDLVLTLDTSADVLEQAAYEIQATAGAGGKVSFVQNATDSDGVYDSNFDEATAGTPYQQLTETLKAGSTTSSTFTFTPDAGNKIGKVVINGVEQVLTEAQKTSTYTYQFINVSSDQTIYATFVDATTGEEKSDPYITVELGSHGKADITAETGTEGSMTPVGTNPFDPATVTGPKTEIYNVPMETLNDGEKENMKIEITPDDGYEIDTILIGSTVQPKPDDYNPTVGWTEGTVEIELKDGLTESVVITFKPIGEPSIQAIVISRIKEGFGAVTPYGQHIYAVGEQPTYTMTPAEHWTMDVTKDSVLLDGDDKSTDVDWTDKGTQDYVKGAAVTYQLPALAGGVTTLEVTFFEQSITVHGLVRLTTSVGQGGQVAPAHLKFYRKADAEKQTDAKTVEFDSKATVMTYSGTPEAGATYMQLQFEGEIPAGTWQVTVTKQGYLTYIIDAFTVDDAASHDIYFGDEDCQNGTAEGAASKMIPIPLVIGDAAGGGTAVALDDAAMVSAGWLSSNKNLAKRIKADLDEDTYSRYLADNTQDGNVKSDSSDMLKIKQNINKKRIKTDYATFSTVTP